MVADILIAVGCVLVLLGVVGLLRAVVRAFKRKPAVEDSEVES